MRADALARNRRLLGYGARNVAFKESIDPRPRIRLAIAVEEYSFRRRASRRQCPQQLDRIRPERTRSYLPALAQDLNGVGMPVKVLNRKLRRLAHARTRVIKKQYKGMVAFALRARTVRSIEKRLDLFAIQTGDGRYHSLLEGDHANLGAPLKVFRSVLTDEAGKGMDGAQALVARARCAAALTFDVLQKDPDTLGGKVEHRQFFDWPTRLRRSERQQLQQHIAIAFLGIEGEVALTDEVLKQEAAHPGSNQGGVNHDGALLRNAQTACLLPATAVASR